MVQKEKKTEPTEEAAFKVTYYDAQWNQVEADLTKVTDAGIASEFGTESIYSMPQPDTKMGFNVDPLMEGELEVTWSFEALIGGDKFDNTDERSVTCDDGKNLTVFLSSPVSEEIHILIKDKTTLANKKVLIITPNN